MKLASYISIIMFTWGLVASCVPTHHLEKQQNLLYSIKLQGVEVNDPAKISTLYKQKANRKVLGATPYLSLYYFGRKFYNPAKIQRWIDEYRVQTNAKIAAAGTDSVKISDILAKREERLAVMTRKKEEGNWLMTVGEPPAIYDTLKTQSTLRQIKTYLNTKGFFHAQVSHTEKIKNKKVYLTLIVKEDQPTKITQLNYNIADSVIAHLVDSTRSKALLRTGQNYDEEIIDQERNRLEILLRNMGFYEFRKPFITAKVDTNFAPYSAHFTYIIANDADNQPHKQYRIRQVSFISDAGLNRFGFKRDTIRYNNVKYLAYRHKINPKVLDSKLNVYPKQRYSLDLTQQTQQQLNNLDMFRFNSVNYVVVPDSTKGAQLDAFVNVSPTKKYQETSEAGGSYTALLPGPFVNLRLKVRNIFGGAEILDIGVRGGLQGQYSSLDFNESIYMKDLGGNVGLTFPQFLVPFRVNKQFNRFNPRSRLNIAYTYVDRREYIRTNLETTFDYIWQPSPTLQYVLTPLDVSLVKTPRLSPDFDSLLNRNTTYGQSFTNAVVPSINFMRFYNNFRNDNSGQFWRLYTEAGGLTTLLAEQFNNNEIIDHVGDLRLYKFLRINSDFRKYYKLSNKAFVVYRFNVGIAQPVRSKGLPYDKYFFGGGGSSIRAWRPRRLGPGAYQAQRPRRDPESNEIMRDIAGNILFEKDYDTEQPGELLIETNLEHRFNIVGYLNGAFFIDAGNTWMLSKDVNRPDSEFEWKDFLSEFAVGVGTGLRFDFNFLIARFDFSTKVFDPSFSKGKRYVLNQFTLNDIFNRNNNHTTFNLGIGYPF
ncbi:BamA/TamA family outer membrane protein [Adhaeribacter swui]|uniref:BamA/TamA family outer membrane protein n=1 Tax=Adhaeribacter swui TaxID=2086471 RepID=A0A7G7GDE6_9BACT|nr:BamA/TamA family outer membrane protein [Adhaeribacter swui]QNF35180.1 BamA/TamA family outer membrane protein [Adhaeribacter swui]